MHNYTNINFYSSYLQIKILYVIINLNTDEKDVIFLEDLDETVTTENQEPKIEQIETFNEEQKENSPEASIETPSESVEIKTEDANTTNCLALTIQEDHKIVALKNVFLRSIRMSWKVVVSTITLALLKLFS